MDRVALQQLIRANVQEMLGCWIWQRSLTVRGGYPQVYHPSLGKGPHRGNRVSYEAFVGPLEAGQVAAHRCDTPACLNPEHLFAADQAGNLSDMRAKGRGFRKLSDDDVRAIRAEWTGRRGQLTEMGKRFGVHPRSIRFVVDGEHHPTVK